MCRDGLRQICQLKGELLQGLLCKVTQMLREKAHFSQGPTCGSSYLSSIRAASRLTARVGISVASAEV